ncbi:hypothetical protein BD311DRAFT_736715 [Dichomitus squalens]|uniref:Uncharacterized protein n=1 Tax=Dichomitus squalens TaxID=114155 RepID=A0A4Q9N1J0_9APHY|nr:hypothetical protein BD311DRAFT_736715 [Dichomitus squalens]
MTYAQLSVARARYMRKMYSSRHLTQIAHRGFAELELDVFNEGISRRDGPAAGGHAYWPTWYPTAGYVDPPPRRELLILANPVQDPLHQILRQNFVPSLICFGGTRKSGFADAIVLHRKRTAIKSPCYHALVGTTKASRAEILVSLLAATSIREIPPVI